ncbi:DNA adenine methylase [Reyranella sp.]|uniref:DNA adenine methylase n=1 Tax=Reyranella sp. TaxID=1929291 RepID=UPI003BABFCF9
MEHLDSYASPSVGPFLKWAGGKRWLAARYGNLLPTDFANYLEPFLGSGAVFFHLRPKNAVLSDKNSALINVYQQIRCNWQAVHRALSRHQKCHSKQYYYEERRRRHRLAHEEAAQFLYLNRTCWNGLYRVNLRGQFNVPIGTKSSVILDTDDFAGASNLLRDVNLEVSDFEKTVDMARLNDFLFVDPPYTTRHNSNGFIKYNEELFSWADQERLAYAVRRAAARGVKVLVTNADHDCIRELYLGVGEHIELDRASVLAADPGNRGQITEIAIKANYLS